MRLIRKILIAIFLGPRIPREQLRAGTDSRPREPQFITLVNGGRPVH
jgi:hypothetical protein